jgi:uncharacterized protein
MKTDKLGSFLVNTARLEKGDYDKLEVSKEGVIPGIEMPFSWVPEGSKVYVSVQLELVGSKVLVSGSAKAGWIGTCRRCLENTAGLIQAELKDFYSYSPAIEDEYPMANSTLDLSLVARDALLVELPLAPLCNQACLGLCQNCGKNLNSGSCSCSYEPNNPFKVLDVLKNENRLDF